MKASKLKNLSLRQIVATLLLIATVVFQFSLPAQAETLTPEASEYNVPNTGAYGLDQDINAGKGLKQSLKDVADNVREKLNLDEPVPESTKDFFRSTEEKVEDTLKPITRRDEQTFQKNVPVR